MSEFGEWEEITIRDIRWDGFFYHIPKNEQLQYYRINPERPGWVDITTIYLGNSYSFEFNDGEWSGSILVHKQWKDDIRLRRRHKTSS